MKVWLLERECEYGRAGVMLFNSAASILAYFPEAVIVDQDDDFLAFDVEDGKYYASPWPVHDSIRDVLTD